MTTELAFVCLVGIWLLAFFSKNIIGRSSLNATGKNVGLILMDLFGVIGTALVLLPLL